MPARRKSELWRSVIETAAAPLLALVILAAWQIIVQVGGISEFVLPTPWTIIKRIVADWALLGRNAWITALEVIFGFGIAVITGIPTALMIFYSRVFERAVYPLLVALQTVPKVVLAPLLVLYLGYDWAPKIFLAFLISFFPIVIATVVGLQSLERPMISLLRAMGANEWQIFRKLRIPAALPNIFGGFKVGISLAVIGAVIGEYVAAERGIGYLQLQANAKFDTTLSFAAVVVISLVGVLLFSIISFLERRIVFERERAK